MSAQIINLARRDRGPIRVERIDDGDWHVIHDGKGWPHASRELAMREANQLAKQINAVIVVGAPC